MKTLYISDLDGTLLRPDQTLSDHTVQTLNRLIGEGLIFSYATARSVKTAGKVTEKVNLNVPVIVHNGVYLVESGTGRTVASERFTEAEAREIQQSFLERGLYPLVYSRIGGRERVSFVRKKSSRPQMEFVDGRIMDGYDSGRFRELADESGLLDGEAYYFACIGGEDALRLVYEPLREKYRCFFAQDIYSEAYWLEILPKAASKAASALKLKNMLGCDKLVCFGDEINDIPMFEVADECYAVKNAAEELKKIATGVVGSNAEDGVAEWLSLHAETGR